MQFLESASTCTASTAPPRRGCHGSRLAGEHVQRGEQRRHSVASVGIRHGLAPKGAPTIAWAATARPTSAAGPGRRPAPRRRSARARRWPRPCATSPRPSATVRRSFSTGCARRCLWRCSRTSCARRKALACRAGRAPQLAAGRASERSGRGRGAVQGVAREHTARHRAVVAKSPRWPPRLAHPALRDPPAPAWCSRVLTPPRRDRGCPAGFAPVRQATP